MVRSKNLRSWQNGMRYITGLRFEFLDAGEMCGTTRNTFIVAAKTTGNDVLPCESQHENRCAAFLRLIHTYHAVNITLLPYGICMELFRWGWRQHVIRNVNSSLKLKPVLLLFLCYVFTVYSSFDSLWTTTVESLQIYKYYNNFKIVPLVFHKSKRCVKFSFFFSCSRHITNSVFSFISVPSSKTR
jgi:hypothetical protein